MSAPEAGMTIMRSTLCRVGGHTWTWASTSESWFLGNRKPREGSRCDCGLLKWEERDEPDREDTGR